MSIVLPDLYHWSPALNRSKIQKRGLRPTTPTTVGTRPVAANIKGHFDSDDELISVKSVCLGTSPSTAWSLSGVWTSEVGEEWDLWQVRIMKQQEVHVQCEMGDVILEVRVLDPIPRSQIWYVGSRIRRSRSRWFT